MANVTPLQTMLAKRALMVLRSKTAMMSNVNRQFETEIAARDRRAGGIVNIKIPPRYTGRRGELFKPEGTVINTLPMQLQLYGQDLSFSLLDLQLSYDAVAKGAADESMEPAMAAIAALLETDGTLLYRTVANTVGSTTVMPTTTTPISTAGAYITAGGGQLAMDRTALLDSFVNASLADSLKLVFNPVAEISKAYLDGRMGKGYGFTFYDEAFIQTHTAGVYSGTPAVNGAAQNGAALITNGWTAGSILNVGDTFTIAGVNLVNPQSRQNIGRSAFFVVGATSVADGSGNMTIALGAKGLIPSGQFQNVSASPANGALLTVTSGASGVQSRQSLLYDKNAFTFASVPMAAVPSGRGAESVTVTDDESGLGITMTEFYDGDTNQMKTRFDVLGAWAATYPELAVRLESPAS